MDTLEFDDREEQFHMMLFTSRDGLGLTFEEANAKALAEGGSAVWHELSYMDNEVLFVVGTALGEGFTAADRAHLTTDAEDVQTASAAMEKALERFGAPFGPLMLMPIRVSRPFTIAEA